MHNKAVYLRKKEIEIDNHCKKNVIHNEFIGIYRIKTKYEI